MLPTKKVIEILGIDRERIKYYKKMDVFVAESQQSGYYTENDVENLRKLVVLGKAGLTCDDIKKVQTGKITLIAAIEERRKKIEEKMKQMKGSLYLSAEMLECGIQYDSMETGHYWGIVTQRESEGEKFMDIDDGYWQISLIRTVECPHCLKEQEIDLEDFLYDESSYEKENGMGPDIVYSFDSEENYECPFCGKMFQVSGWIREYPMGMYDSENVDITKLDEEDEQYMEE